eukprot:scaffold39431_cov29-Prasinocladus_malaysianus.AAC.1
MHITPRSTTTRATATTRATLATAQKGNASVVTHSKNSRENVNSNIINHDTRRSFPAPIPLQQHKEYE